MESLLIENFAFVSICMQSVLAVALFEIEAEAPSWFAYDGSLIISTVQDIMQNLSNYSLSQLHTLEAQVIEELKKRHFLGISQAREQILHIARGAGISVDELLSGKAPKESKPGSVPVKYRHPDEPTHQWSGRGRQPAWVKDWIASGKSLDEARV